MSLATSLRAMATSFDPMLSHWEVVLSTGKRRSEREMIPTFVKGIAGVRALDWALDLASTGDTARIKEIWLICPSGQKAMLEIVEPHTAFQFKSKSLGIMTGGSQLDYQVIGRVTDKVGGACECWIWDYHPSPGQPQFLAYRSNVHAFGAWRDTMMPVGALALAVQGLRL